MTVAALTRSHTATRQRWTVGQDAAGRPTRTLASSLAVAGRLSHSSNQQNQAAGVTSEQGTWRFDCAPDADIGAADTLVVDGVTFEVIGAPYVARARTNVGHHMIVHLREQR